MTPATQAVLRLNLDHLSHSDITFLHDLKAKAIRAVLRTHLNNLRNRRQKPENCALTVHSFPDSDGENRVSTSQGRRARRSRFSRRTIPKSARYRLKNTNK